MSLLYNRPVFVVVKSCTVGKPCICELSRRVEYVGCAYECTSMPHMDYKSPQVPKGDTRKGGWDQESTIPPEVQGLKI